MCAGSVRSQNQTYFWLQVTYAQFVLFGETGTQQHESTSTRRSCMHSHCGRAQCFRSQCRIDTQYAEPTLVAAHRALLAAALQDPRNTMFVLLSESCTPIYHPAVVWAQLISESHVSRVSQGIYNGWRWHGFMHTDHLWGQHFRKTSQWSSLTRMHALLAVHDEHVWPQFAQFCRTLVRCRRRPVATLSTTSRLALACLIP